MEGEDEEFEKLLGEIPQAMESNNQLDDLESAGTAHPEENTYMMRSHSIESLQGLFAFKPNPDDDKCIYSMRSSNSDGAMTTDTHMDFSKALGVKAQTTGSSVLSIYSHPGAMTTDTYMDFSKALGVKAQTTGSVNKEVPTDASLAIEFANIKLEAGAPMQSNFAGHHYAEVSLDTPHSAWLADASSFDSDMKHSRPITHAVTDEHLRGVPKKGGYGSAYGRPFSLEHRGSPLSQCTGDNNITNLKPMGLDSGIHQVFGVRVIPNQPFMYQAPMPCSVQEEGVPRIYHDGKDGWQYNSKVLAYLQPQQLPKLKLLQQAREGETIDEVLAHHPRDCIDVEYNNGISAFAACRDHGYARLGVGNTCSCGYPLRQKLVNPYVNNFCSCCTQDVCGRGDDCSAFQDMLGGATRNKPFQVGSALLSNGLLKAPTCPPLFEEKPQVRILSKKSTRVAAPASAPLVGWCHNNKIASSFRGQGACKQCSTAGPNEPPGQENLIKPAWGLRKAYQLTDALQQGPFYSTLADIEGRISAVAKDQHGCRFLQRKFDEGSREDVQKIFVEVLDHAVDLMVDPFGNYLIQKLLEVCTDDQRSDLLQSITSKGELVNVSLNMHGTRAVQKLIETLKSRQQVATVTASLRSGVVTLIKDLNGNHVIQRCLQHLSNEDNQFIFEAAAHNCVEIGTHRHGCCVLQRCIDHSTGVARQNLIWEIASNSLRLAQDSFGNYVVQYVLELGLPWAIKEVIHRLVENYARLSMQKFSSNVVEKCLKLSEEESRARIVRELIDSSQLLQLLQDPYANYVIQSALMISKGALHASLVEAIRPHVPLLRSSPYGKRILSRRSLKRN